MSTDTSTELAVSTDATQGPTQPLVPPPGYDQQTALECTYLVDVASSMCVAWIQAGMPTDWSGWTPSNLCSVTSSLYSTDDFAFTSLIASTFSSDNQQHWEPFGFIATKGNTYYLVFRGSQTSADGAMDLQDELVGYTPPTASPPSGLQTEQGFTAVFNGIGGLPVPPPVIPLPPFLPFLPPLPAIHMKLVITGHSLGSALATLAVPAMLAGGWSAANVVNYPQASPMVGDPNFVAYYDALGVPTFRLVNSYDVVPTLPGSKRGYAHVGVAATFGADYGSSSSRGFKRSIPDNHDPCCSYSYALLNPSAPYNQSLPTCMDWHPPTSGAL